MKDFYGGTHPVAEEGSPEAVEEEYHQPPKPAEAGLGETITLTGTNIGVRLRVTVTGVKRVSSIWRSTWRSRAPASRTTRGGS